jgi:hypothetical protein
VVVAVSTALLQGAEYPPVVKKEVAVVVEKVPVKGLKNKEVVAV